jgi:hypothetical protein
MKGRCGRACTGQDEAEVAATLARIAQPDLAKWQPWAGALGARIMVKV